MSVHLTISGDCCITDSWLNQDLLAEDIIDLFAKQDYNIVNLECPVVAADPALHIKKLGPHLRTSAGILKHLQQLNISLVTLANNHILDFGEKGLTGTIQQCLKKGITYAGVGKNLQEASLPVFIEKNDVRIAIVNCCENEWSIAGDTDAGANPYDIVDITQQLQQAKAMADFVLLIVHGGNESYELPSPRMQKQFRFLSQQGADAVICHHAHCISGMEVYKGVPIFYGLGNLVFTTPNDVPGWNHGITLQLQLEKAKPLQWEIIPTVQADNTYRLSLAADKIKQDIEAKLATLNATIADPAKLQQQWKAFVLNNSAQYLYTLSAMNAIPGRYVRAILKRMGLMKWIFPERYVKGIMNYINCEAHLDVSRDVLSKKLYNT